MRITAVFALVLDLLYCLDAYAGFFEIPCVLMIVLLSLMLCVKVRRNSVLFVMSVFIAWANYSAMVANYSSDYAALSSYDTIYQGTWVAARGTFFLLLFMAALVLTLPKSIRLANTGGLKQRYEGHHSLPITLVMCVILLVIWVTSSSGFSGSAVRGEANQLFEYSYLLFIVGFYFAAERKACQYMLLSVALAYVLQNLLTGNRAGVLAIILLVYVLYFAERIPTKFLVPLLIMLFLFFMFLGSVRQEILSSFDRLPEVIHSTFKRGLVWDTASFAYHQGLAFTRLSNDIGYDQWMHLTVSWLLGIPLGATAVPDSVLSLYAQRFYPGMGGGFLPQYFSFYGGAIGTAISGVLVSRVYALINGITVRYSDLRLWIALSCAITIPRWYLYSPSPLTRGLLLLSIVYMVASLASEKTTK